MEFDLAQNNGFLMTEINPNCSDCPEKRKKKKKKKKKIGGL
jgi:hypothetical protein